MEAFQTIGNLTNYVGVMAHASAFSAGFLCAIHFLDCCLVVNPKNNFTLGVDKIMKGAKVVQEFNDSRCPKQLGAC